MTKLQTLAFGIVALVMGLGFAYVLALVGAPQQLWLMQALGVM